ncbi:MAG: hypothetical protein KGH70_01055 [Rhodospirillales bacterium]|nr:hypothetical protein [Rhodospirillales bacterium]
MEFGLMAEPLPMLLGVMVELSLLMEFEPMEFGVMAEPLPMLLPLLMLLGLMLLGLMAEPLPMLLGPILLVVCANAAPALARERTQAVMVRIRDM